MMLVPLSVDLAQIAGLYSALAGVLAGFAFAGLVTLIAAQIQGGSAVHHSLTSVVPLVSAFLGLVGASLNYAIIAGDGSTIARATVLESVGGLGFAAAGIMLFYSILVLINGVHRDATIESSVSSSLRSLANFLRGVILMGVSPALLFLMEGGIRDQEVRHYRLPSTAGHLFPADYLSGGLAAAFFVAGLVLTLRSTHGRSPAVPEQGEHRAGLALPISILTATIALASVIATTAVSLYVPETYAGGTGEWVLIQIVMSGYLACVIIATQREQ